ncbi:hypothetical protein F441_09825 [Phytophthora nicotianae CJ01A1]|uniref:Uncharacterized protein n=1 Tax=Phytophthora nicotianae CJ01A1 TaxID=1317063 RepID=W2WY12_PHYNI|nr:hypothetical protein F441_09825 [Phytophthora nicotianae CJ01A1]
MEEPDNAACADATCAEGTTKELRAGEACKEAVLDCLHFSRIRKSYAEAGKSPAPWQLRPQSLIVPSTAMLEQSA